MTIYKDKYNNVYGSLVVEGTNDFTVKSLPIDTINKFNPTIHDWTPLYEWLSDQIVYFQTGGADDSSAIFYSGDIINVLNQVDDILQKHGEH